MLRSMKDMEDYSVVATDGVVGKVQDLYFDDESWVVRYLVIQTGEWLTHRRVLITPISVDEPDWSEKKLPVSITQEQVKNSPDIDTDKPVSRQHEREYLGYYGYPYYWGGAGLWGGFLYPSMMLPTAGYGGSNEYRHAQGQNARAAVEADAERHQNDDPHLRSGNAIMRYHVHAADGDVGHVAGLIIDDKTWAVRYLIVNTSNWWLGHEVLIAPRWITDFDWLDRKMVVDVTRDAVKTASPYDSAVALNRDDEARTHAHYGRIGYWAQETKHEDAAAAARHARSSAPPLHDGIL